MPTDYRITGARELRELGRDLKAEGRADPFRAKCLRAELFQAFQRATKPVKEEIRRSALESLPKRGGLNVYIAELKTVTQSRISGASIGVRITSSKSKKAHEAHRRKFSRQNRGLSRRAQLPKGILFGKGLVDLRRLDAGRAKHPTYGHRPWVLQDVTPGFFTRVVKGSVTVQRCRNECLKAIEQTRRRLIAGGRHAA